MASLKNNIHTISDDTENLAKNYLKLFSVRQAEKLAIFLGILASVFVLATILLVVIVFGSFVLAGALNKLLSSDFWGFMIVGSLYLLWIVFLIVKIFRTNTPLFANLFVKLIISVFNIDSDQSNSINGLKKEGEHIKHKIETDKTRIEADFQILRYTIMGSIFKEILGLFTSKKKVKEDPPDEQNKEEA